MVHGNLGIPRVVLKPRSDDLLESATDPMSKRVSCRAPLGICIPEIHFPIFGSGRYYRLICAGAWVPGYWDSEIRRVGKNRSCETYK